MMGMICRNAVDDVDEIVMKSSLVVIILVLLVAEGDVDLGASIG